MDQDTLSKLTVTELKSLCFNRDIGINGRIAKQTLINKLLSYHKKNKYKKLKFEKNLKDWKKDELVLELRARGTKNGNRNKQHIAYKLMHNGQSPMKKKIKTKLIQNNQNKNDKNKKKKTEQRQKSKLKHKEENMMKAYKALESMNVNIWSDLQNGFKPVNLNTKLPHNYTDFHDKVEIPEDIGDDLDSFGDKLLQLLPLILEIESILTDFSLFTEKMRKKIMKKEQKRKRKMVYYVGMKKYKKKKYYNTDEIGPICGVFDNIKQFDQFRNDQSVKKEFGKNIQRIRYIPKQLQNQNDNDHFSVSEDDSLSDDDGDIIPSDQDYDIQQNDFDDDDQNNDENNIAEIVITTNNDIDDESDDDDDDDDDENENENKDKNKNKNQTKSPREITKKAAMTKNTRSRREAANKKVSGRKRRRDNNENNDELNENPKKRLKVNQISG